MDYYPITPFRITHKNPVNIQAIIHSDIPEYDKSCLKLAVSSYGFLIPFNISLNGKGFSKLILQHYFSDQTREITRILNKW